MHRTGRQVRFSVNPFLPQDMEGANSFASRPAGEGLSMFLELTVELAGEVEPTTGFLGEPGVNVVDIDKKVRGLVVPIFAKRIRQEYREGRHIGLCEIAELLKSGWGCLADKFGTARLHSLSLKPNPFRKIAIESEDCEMIYFSEKFGFAATHRLWNAELSDARNFEIFGKCANPAGHGHNYIVEVTVKRPAADENFSIGRFEEVVDDNLITVLDHKNLNVEVAEFAKTNPTVENIAVFAWDKLSGKFGEGELYCVTVWETDKTYSSYYG